MISTSDKIKSPRTLTEGNLTATLLVETPQQTTSNNIQTTDTQSNEQLQLDEQRIVMVGTPQVIEYKNNFVKTSKYEWYNFLPKFLFETFNPKHKLANCYFLFISAFQCIPPISNTNGYPTTLIPLMIVIFIDGIFQCLEDYNRHMSDQKANATITKWYNKNTHSFDHIKWSELCVGDIIQVDSRHAVPADIVILAVSEKTTHSTGI